VLVVPQKNEVIQLGRLHCRGREHRVCLTAVMRLVHEKVSEHPSQRLARACVDAFAAVKGDDAVIVRFLEPGAKGNQPLVAQSLALCKFVCCLRRHITCPDVAHLHITVQRSNVVMIHIEHVIERERQAGEEADPRRMKLGIRQLRNNAQ